MKKIRITDPKELKEGMRVEYKNREDVHKGVLVKDSDGDFHVPDAPNYLTHFDRWGCKISDVYQITDEPRTIEDLKQGDVIVENDGYYRKCLGVGGEVYHMSECDRDLDHNDLKKLSNGFTMFEIKGFNWKLHQPEQEEIVEMTLEEVAELKGVDVSKLRIKD